MAYTAPESASPITLSALKQGVNDALKSVHHGFGMYRLLYHFQALDERTGKIGIYGMDSCGDLNEEWWCSVEVLEGVIRVQEYPCEHYDSLCSLLFSSKEPVENRAAFQAAFEIIGDAYGKPIAYLSMPCASSRLRK